MLVSHLLLLHSLTVKRVCSFIGLLVALTCASLQAGSLASVQIAAFPDLAPNAYGSPSFGQFVTNSITALQNGDSAYGDPNSPTYYQQRASATYQDTIVTGFPSWLGQIDPATAFGANYTNELGNRITFSGFIDGHGTQFSISELGFSAVATGNDTLTFGCGYGDPGFCAGQYNYSPSYVGEIDGVGGPQYITSGANTQLVDKLWMRGSGNSMPAYCSGTCDAADQTAAIQAAVAAIYGTQTFTGTYTLQSDADSVQGAGTFIFTDAPTPEPSTLGCLGFGLLALATAVRKRRN